jgi:hypothetical protein
MLRIFSSSNLALLDSSDIEEVHQDFEMEKGGINRHSTVEEPCRVLLLLESRVARFFGYRRSPSGLRDGEGRRSRPSTVEEACRVLLLLESRVARFFGF